LNLDTTNLPDQGSTIIARTSQQPADIFCRASPVTQERPKHGGSDPRKSEGHRAPSMKAIFVRFRVAAANLLCRWFCECEKAIGKLRRLRLPLPPGKWSAKPATA
jgi:hypothetical protein